MTGSAQCPAGAAVLTVLLILLIAACSRVEYRPEPLDPAQIQSGIQDKSIDEQAFREYINTLAADRTTPETPWDLRLLTLAAFYHNPGLRVAYEELRLSRARVQTASQRINPRLNMPLEYHSDTDFGEDSPWMFGLLLDFIYERQGKREARIERARAGVESARLRIREVAWRIRTELHSAYLDYFSSLQARQLAAERHELLQSRLTILKQRYATGHIGKAEVANTEIEMRGAELALANLETQVGDKYHHLVATTGLQADDFDKVDFEFGVFEDLAPVMAMDKADFRESALLQRADIRKVLSDYNALEHALRLEIEKQYPDITLSPGLVFDQGDKIWAIGSAWMLPMFHNNDGPIAEALAERSVMQARVMQLQADILGRLNAVANRFESLQGNLEIARDIRNEAQARAGAISNQFTQGYSDRLQLIDARLDLLESRHSLLKSRTALLESVVRLESIIQTPLYKDFDVEQSMELLYSLNELSDNDA